MATTPIDVQTPAPSATNGREPAPRGLHVDGLVKHFTRSNGETVAAVDGVSLRIEKGAFCVLLGPSGCGKTTLLRCIAGLEEPSVGEIVIDDRTVYSGPRRVSIESRHRNLGMVFQTYALWPHMRVAENVAFPLTTGPRRQRPSRKDIGSRVQRALDVVGVGDLAGQPVSALSGGQQQRVALARAIVGGSTTILFDEPLSNVDAKVRVQLRAEIHRLQRELEFTALYVTHDQDEAMELADHIVVLQDGRVEQQGTPRQIYRAPASAYVAEFVGTSDLIDGRIVERTDGACTVQTPMGPLDVIGDLTSWSLDQDVTVVIRAEDWVVSPADGPPVPARNRFAGTVEHVAFMGAFTQYLLRVGESPVRVRVPGESDHGDGRLVATIHPTRCRLVRR